MTDLILNVHFMCVCCSKATTLERTYGPAWIAYGHSFAVESEHDQAMAAYFTAAQLMKGLVDSLVLCDLSQWSSLSLGTGSDH